MAELISATDDAALDRAQRVLESGGTLVVPTDTVYGLAALPASGLAVDTIFRLKRRPEDMHLAVLVDSIVQVADVSAAASSRALALMDCFWPGPLTVVLGGARSALSTIGPSDGSVGVRCPDHAWVRALCARVGPIATTSANRHGEPTPPSAAEIATQMPEVDLVVDGGTIPGGVASTVVDVRGDEPVMLRLGPITEDQLVEAWAV